MRYRPLGSTGLQISEISFGAGPVSGLMTDGSPDAQRNVIAHAIRSGINWFDTAAGYGNGRSEANLGSALKSIETTQPIHVATKVRLMLHGETDLRPLVIESFRASLQRLQLPKVTLLQVHNSITRHRDDEPTSITPEDVLGPQGILAAMDELRAEGLVDHFGLTGIGQADALRTVIHTGRFATIQAPLHVLNPTALIDAAAPHCTPNYGGFLHDAASMGMGIMAIRVFAGGALLDAPPSAHTLKTLFFPLDLYQRDRAHALRLAQSLGDGVSMSQWALRFVLSQREVSSCLLGLATPDQINTAIRNSELGPLSETDRNRLAVAIESLDRPSAL